MNFHSYHLSSLAVKSLRNFIHLFGPPSRISSDQGKCLTKFVLKKIIDRHFIANDASKANGRVERVMQVLTNILTVIEIEESTSWQYILGDVS